MFTRAGASPPARAALEAVLDDHYHLLVDSLASGRGLPRAAILRALDQGPFTATDARRRDLLDTLIYDAEVDSFALRRAGRHAALLPLARFAERLPGGHGGKQGALIVAEGGIVSGKSQMGAEDGRQAGAETPIAARGEAGRNGAVQGGGV